MHLAATRYRERASTVRRHPRLRLNTPVELRSGPTLAVGRTENVSLGGLLVSCPSVIARGSHVGVRFNLPGGQFVSATGIVVHVQTSGELGIQFLSLPSPHYTALTEALPALMDYTRSGARVARRHYLTVRQYDAPETTEELAETVVLSRAGGMMVSRARLKVADRIFLWWPEGNRGATARIVFRRLGNVAGLAELGFAFEHADNFWGLNFPEDRFVAGSVPPPKPNSHTA